MTGTKGGRAVSLAGGFILPLLLLLGLAAGCGGGSSTPTGPATTGTGVVKLVPPDGCGGAVCTGTSLNGVEVSGPLSLAPFTMNFGIVSTLPFAPPGAYTVFGATFQGSTGDTLGCPAADFTVATAKTTTVTFAINNDVCSVRVSGPA